jgi:hypothetical protein
MIVADASLFSPKVKHFDILKLILNRVSVKMITTTFSISHLVSIVSSMRSIDPIFY